MATERISKRAVDSLIASVNDQYLWDTELSGFGVKITPKGRRTYFVQYRLGGRKGRTRRYTIGVHGTLTTEQARSIAKRILGEVASGKDPLEAKDTERRALTVSEAGERFLTEHARAKLKPRSADAYEHVFRLHIVPAFGHIKLHELTPSRIARLHHEMRTTPYSANRSIAFLSKFMNWTEKHGLRPEGRNPCRHIEKYPEVKRERFLSPVELARLGEAVSHAEKDGAITPWMAGAIRLLALTGARLSEILTLKWDWVNFEHHTIRLPDSKTGAKTIYLNTPALNTLAELPRMEDNPFVICGTKEGAHLVNLQKPWRRVRKMADLPNVRIHDLRHSFASVAVSGNMSLPILGALLGHSQPQTTARYAHLSADPLKAASDAVGERIAAAMQGELISK
ncbi:MAG: tyrosine-type recombinase/integrase [Robiginitomaculum sp.]|nr:tyrosine-type recombinase/integrase [Robiginitomaculum sp.]